MTSLGLEPLIIRSTDEEDHWQSKNDNPNLQTLLNGLQHQQDKGDLQEETPEWIIAPSTHPFFKTTKQTDLLKQISQRDESPNSKAIACLWTATDKRKEEKQAKQTQTWITKMEWKTVTGKVRNQQPDGCLEGRSTCVIAANERITQRLPTNFDKSNDGCHCLEQILDPGDRNFKDCFSYFTKSKEDRKPSGEGAQIKTTLEVQHGDETKNINIFDINNIDPTLANEKNSFGTNAFPVEATDGIA
jgi:hypothetical protein